jgi:hypothetical protein
MSPGVAHDAALTGIDLDVLNGQGDYALPPDQQFKAFTE